MNNRDVFIDIIDELDRDIIDTHLAKLASPRRKYISYGIAVAVYAAACILVFAAIPHIIDLMAGKPPAIGPGANPIVTTDTADTTGNTTVAKTDEPAVDSTDEYIIYDGQGITVTAGNMEYDENGLMFDCTVENYTGTELSFIIDISAVNGFMTGTYAGGTSFDTDGAAELVVRVEKDTLERQFIKDIRFVEFRLYAYDDNRNFYLNKEYSTITFSDDPAADDIEGRTVYDGSELKVTYLGLGTDGTGSRSPAFLLENMTDKDMDIYLNSLCIDGKDVEVSQMTSGMAGSGVLLNPGKKSVFVPDAFAFLTNEGEFSGFDNTDTVELTFVAKEWIEKTDIFVTESVLLSFPEDGDLLQGSGDSGNGADDTPQGDGGFVFVKYGDGLFYAKDEIGDDGLRRIYYVPVIDGEICYNETVTHEYRDGGLYIITPAGSTFLESYDTDTKESWKDPGDVSGVEKFDIAEFEKYR